MSPEMVSLALDGQFDSPSPEARAFCGPPHAVTRPNMVHTAIAAKAALPGRTMQVVLSMGLDSDRGAPPVTTGRPRSGYPCFALACGRNLARPLDRRGPSRVRLVDWDGARPVAANARRDG